MGISVIVCWLLVTGLQIVSMKSLKERNDAFLRFDELPCPEYDRKVTHNKVRM